MNKLDPAAFQEWMSKKYSTCYVKIIKIKDEEQILGYFKNDEDMMEMFQNNITMNFGEMWAFLIFNKKIKFTKKKVVKN